MAELDVKVAIIEWPSGAITGRISFTRWSHLRDPMVYPSIAVRLVGDPITRVSRW